MRIHVDDYAARPGHPEHTHPPMMMVGCRCSCCCCCCCCCLLLLLAAGVGFGFVAAAVVDVFVCRWSFVVCCLLSVPCCLLFVACCLRFVACGLWFVVWCLVLVVVQDKAFRGISKQALKAAKVLRSPEVQWMSSTGPGWTSRDIPWRLRWRVIVLVPDLNANVLLYFWLSCLI